MSLLDPVDIMSNSKARYTIHGLTKLSQSRHCWQLTRAVKTQLPFRSELLHTLISVIWGYIVYFLQPRGAVISGKEDNAKERLGERKQSGLETSLVWSVTLFASDVIGRDCVPGAQQTFLSKVTLLKEMKSGEKESFYMICLSHCWIAVSFHLAVLGKQMSGGADEWRRFGSHCLPFWYMCSAGDDGYNCRFISQSSPMWMIRYIPCLRWRGFSGSSCVRDDSRQFRILLNWVQTRTQDQGLILSLYSTRESQ